MLWRSLCMRYRRPVLLLMRLLMLHLLTMRLLAHRRVARSDMSVLLGMRHMRLLLGMGRMVVVRDRMSVRMTVRRCHMAYMGWSRCRVVLRRLRCMLLTRAVDTSFGGPMFPGTSGFGRTSCPRIRMRKSASTWGRHDRRRAMVDRCAQRLIVAGQFTLPELQWPGDPHRPGH
jgi:hypothetical protein